jgi:uncharacterized protein
MQSQAADYFYFMVRSPVFLSAFFSWFLAQILKAVIEAVRQRSRSSRDVMVTLFWKTGGMPSSHSSLVTSLATSIGFEYGTGSPLFTLSLFYGLLIIRDALGVRRAAGLQAQTLNQINNDLRERYSIEFAPVREIHGHTPAEVSVGILLGFFIAVAFSML